MAQVEGFEPDFGADTSTKSFVYLQVDPIILQTMCTLIFAKSNETFISNLNIHKNIIWKFSKILEKVYILLSLFYIKVACRSLNYP